MRKQSKIILKLPNLKLSNLKLNNVPKRFLLKLISQTQNLKYEKEFVFIFSMFRNPTGHISDVYF